MDGIDGAVDQAFPELFGWLAGQGIAPGAAPFIRYPDAQPGGPEPSTI
ncbi:MAG TPA: hypothetical protein VH589_19020 [Trebonia sp.]